MKILVKEKNLAKLNAAIKEAEGRATARTIDAETIFKCAAHIERVLGIPKVKMIGIVANVDYHSQNFPNAYKYTPESTHFTMEYTKSGWVLLDVSRRTTRRQAQCYRLSLTPTAKDAIVHSMEEFE